MDARMLLQPLEGVTGDRAVVKEGRASGAEPAFQTAYSAIGAQIK